MITAKLQTLMITACVNGVIASVLAVTTGIIFCPTTNYTGTWYACTKYLVIYAPDMYTTYINELDIKERWGLVILTRPDLPHKMKSDAWFEHNTNLYFFLCTGSRKDRSRAEKSVTRECYQHVRINVKKPVHEKEYEAFQHGRGQYAYRSRGSRN